jgi:glycerophosphoryl diester phosphodiesterase
VISSLDYQAVLKAKELDNRLQVGYILYGAFGRSFDLQTDFFSVSKDIVSQSFITKAHERNKDVHIWTYSDRPNALERFIYLGVDNIITDYPAELVALLKRRAEMNDIDRLKENFLKWLER